MILLPLLFFVTALFYSAVGFGGGSTYTALLVLNQVDYRAVPILSLLCNVIVVSVGTWRFARGGHFDWRRAWPLFAASVPAAWLGGRMVIQEGLFTALLGLALLVAGLLMLWQPVWQRAEGPAAAGRWVEPLAGAGLGFLAGLVGIGGGIFLAPLLYLLRWDAPKRIAATCAAFILVNSIAGLVGQTSKGVDATIAVVGEHWTLFPAVAVGGMIGATLGARHVDPKWVRILTAILILFVAGKLLLRWVA